MGRRQRLLCTGCGSKVGVVPFCGSCGTPTVIASPEERLAWEKTQWETSRGNAASAKAAGHMNAEGGIATIVERRVDAETDSFGIKRPRRGRGTRAPLPYGPIATRGLTMKTKSSAVPPTKDPSEIPAIPHPDLAIAAAEAAEIVAEATRPTTPDDPPEATPPAATPSGRPPRSAPRRASATKAETRTIVEEKAPAEAPQPRRLAPKKARTSTATQMMAELQDLAGDGPDRPSGKEAMRGSNEPTTPPRDVPASSPMPAETPARAADLTPSASPRSDEPLEASGGHATPGDRGGSSATNGRVPLSIVRNGPPRSAPTPQPPAETGADNSVPATSRPPASASQLQRAVLSGLTRKQRPAQSGSDAASAAPATDTPKSPSTDAPKDQQPQGERSDASVSEHETAAPEAKPMVTTEAASTAAAGDIAVPATGSDESHATASPNGSVSAEVTGTNVDSMRTTEDEDESIEESPAAATEPSSMDEVEEWDPYRRVDAIATAAELRSRSTVGDEPRERRRDRKRRRKAIGRNAGERLSRGEARERYEMQTMSLREGETITMRVEGRSRMRRATLYVTMFRVVLVWRSLRVRPRWIPLEEVTRTKTAWRGATTVIVEAPVEALSFQCASRKSVEPLVAHLEREVRHARQGGTSRHHAEIMQEWVDHTGDVWESEVGRIGLFIRKHPIITAAITGVILFLTYIAGRGY